MSELTPSEACAAVGATSSEPRPERISASVDEKQCTLLYHAQQVEKNDEMKWTIEDTDNGNVYIRFEVKRHQSDRVVYLHTSNEIPASLNLRENLVVKKPPEPDVKNRWYKVKLKKKMEFELTPYFTRPSPPSRVQFP